ncbi:hypothetical protein ACFFIX_10630 [Metabacillus herbersteinensis]|uniref:Protein kinase domain-containing protein n=1 Tax=Metabacillus herbersteinensis TaxID=283816 RepID=A0ABV6GDZ7_9BACI
MKVGRGNLNIPTSNQKSFLLEDELQAIRLWLDKMEQYSYQSTDRIVRKAKKILGLKYPVIGYGVFRIVFDLNNGYVLKVAISRQGQKCNENEVEIYKECPRHLRKHLCLVKEYGHGWIIMKKMTQQVSMNDRNQRKKISELSDKFWESGIRPRDIKSDNLALSNEGDIIFIDYGNFNRSIRNDFFW